MKDSILIGSREIQTMPFKKLDKSTIQNVHCLFAHYFQAHIHEICPKPSLQLNHAGQLFSFYYGFIGILITKYVRRSYSIFFLPSKTISNMCVVVVSDLFCVTQNYQTSRFRRERLIRPKPDDRINKNHHMADY